MTKITRKFSKPTEAKDVLLTNALIVDVQGGKEFKGHVLIEKGIIKHVYKEKETPKVNNEISVIDCKGMLLAPGIIDVQVHIGEPGGSYKENLLQVTQAAVAGGVTTINIIPDTKPVIDTTAMVEYVKNRAIEKAVCNVSLFGAVTRGLEGREITEMGLMKKAGVTGFSDGSNIISDSLVFRRALEYSSDFDAVVVSQPGDKYLSEDGVINEGEISTRLGVSGIPAIAEKIGLDRDLAIVELTKGKYHALNISAEEALESIKNAKAKKLSVTASVTSGHLALTENEANNYRTFAKSNPPYRTEKDRKALIKALKDGVIDFITSNHSPRSVDQKRLPLASAEFGVVGLETMLSAALSNLIPSGFGLSQIFKLLSYNPAQFLNLKNKGQIKKGCIADLILVDIKTNWQVDPENFAGKAMNCPFDGKTLRGRVLKTFISGEVVYESQ